MASGLRKIFLYHSFFGSVLTELDCDAHTNVTGGNAAGKTTTLSLIPVFYGLEPNKVVSRAAEKKSFMGHYLPSKHSMIVFEYERESGVCCSVIYRNGESIAYRFITGAADDTLFNKPTLDALTKDISAKDWFRDVVSQSFPTSIQLTTCIDYRAIIQNDKARTRAKRKQGHGLMLAASKYSLCSSDNEMKHIDSLSSVLISKGKLLSRFKTMVIDSFLADQIDIDHAPFQEKDRAHIGSLQALIELSDRQKDFDEAIQSNVNLKDAWSTLIGVKNSLNGVIGTISSEQNSLTEKGKVIDEEARAKKSGFIEKISALETQIMSLSSRNKSAEQQIDSIHEERDRWDNVVDISLKMADFNNLSAFIEKAQRDAEHYATLVDMAKKEEAEHRAIISDIKEKHQKNVLKARDKIESANFELQGLIDSETREVANRKEAYHLQKDAFSNTRTEKLENLTNELIELNKQSAQAASLTDVESAQVAEVDHKIEEIDDDVTMVAAELKSAHLVVTSLKSKRDEATQRLNNKTNKLSDKRKDREHILSLLFPKDNTLRSFLNENVEEWHEGIGKVIRAELLNAKGLSPQLTTDPLSVLGVSLDLRNTDIPEYAQKNEILEQRKNAIDKDIANLEDEINTIKAKMKAEVKTLREAEHATHQLDRKSQNLAESKKAVTLRKRNLLTDIAQAKAERKTVAAAKLEKHQAKINNHRSETKLALQEREHEHNNDILQYKAIMTSKRSEFGDIISHLKEGIAQLEINLKKRTSELNAAFEAVLQKKGVDPRKEKEAKLRKDASLEKSQEVRGYTELIEQYKVWNKHQWAEVTVMEKELSHNKTLFADESRKLEELRGIMKSTLDVLNTQKSEIERQLAKIGELRKNITTTLSKVTSEVENAPLDHPASQMDEGASVEELISIANTKAQDAREKISKISKLVQKVDSIIYAIDTDNKIYATWKEIKNEVVEKEGCEAGTEKYYLRSLEQLALFLSETLPNIQQLAIEGARTTGEQYIRFYQSLDALNRKISSVSKQLESSINTANKFPALDDIRVTLQSKIQDFNNFGELKLFNSAWNDWGEKGRNSLPDKTFLRAFSDTIDALKSGGLSNNLDSLVDINISLRENGRPVVVRCDQDLVGASSNGVSILAVCVVFCGMTRYLCNDDSVNIHWPFDELANIHESNIILLFEFMNENNITLFCAQPNLSVVLMRYFPIKIQVEHNKGATRYTPRDRKTKNPLLEMAGDDHG